MQAIPFLRCALLLAPTSLSFALGEPAEDPAVTWLAENAVRIRSIDPADDDFSDLEPLKAAIGDARVVQLGEQSHGDGTCFLAKCRLIQFLHQEMGFDVLAWESGFFPCAVMDERIASDEPPHVIAADGLFPVWSNSAECMPVFEYARWTRGSERPLEMAGFDVQLSGVGGLRLGDDVLAFFEEHQELEVDPARIAEFRALWEALMQRTALDDEARSTGEAAIRSLAEAIPAENATREAAFVRRSLEDLEMHQRLKVLFASQETMQEGSNLRDIQMGRNVAWLADEYYAGRKIIVWAASRHIAHDLAKVDTKMPGFRYDEYKTMGDEVHRLLGDEAYTILFDAYEGNAGIAGREPRDIGQAAEGSLTELCHRVGAPYLFVDLKAAEGPGSAWLGEPLVARPFGHAPMEARWREVADAFFYTDTMAPSTAVK